ncbi:LysR family transcriptional regulator [Sporomusa acidovorans]|uniref:HTH-type transcriptional activator CmpR n=1 Tax=Sporomusa acidovorans (strain ATCC 49682 / DSM 3132 / Mol) TaxID=1123286 RepID=A0ABZ3J226_SPOA4|nr:LysR family transcriptional regulator [Sporomusa acidovorans]OZC13633.1 HTH-type transcriptional activator CmpR [Sporomusa acidovorans DSM 3132]SDE86387.1 transcriptional regulator, LysR family [Sporomusa acidovorans]
MSYIQSLTVFLNVAEEGSFSAAAKKLELTQPTVSFHIDNLEKNFGCPLFTRTSKGVSLTIYGEKLFATTRTINGLISETHKEIQAMSQGSAGRILLGASTIPADYILPPLLAKFLQKHPGLTISLVTGDSQTILDKFTQGEIPIAVVGAKPEDAIMCQPLCHDNLVLAAHPDFRVIAQGNAKDWLLKLPFILRKKSSGTARSALDVLAQLDIFPEKLNIIMEVDSNQTVKAAMLNKIGVGFISAWAVENELKSGRLVALPLPGPAIIRQFYAISRPPLQPACLELFWQYLTHPDNTPTT